MSSESLRFLSSILLLAGVLILVATTLPLTIFFWESARDPSLVSFNTTYMQVNNTHVVVNVTLTYKGHIPLKNFKMTIYGKSLDFGDVDKGVYTETIIVNSSQLENRTTSVTFSIGGLYSYSQVSRGG